MYFYIVGASFLKMLSPYLRKYMLTTLDAHDLLYLNSAFFSIIVAFIFIYKYAKGDMIMTIQNYQRLSWRQIVCMLAISAFAVSSTLFVYELDKNYNTPFINYILLIGLTLFSSFLIGICWFNEKYNWQHIVGILMTIFGMYLMIANN